MKATQKTIPTLIEKREPFQNSSNTLRSWKNLGQAEIQGIINHPKNQMDDTEKSRLRIDNNTAGIAYLVVSYDTPIAWETRTGEVYKVLQTFSHTTTKHQGLLYLFHHLPPGTEI